MVVQNFKIIKVLTEAQTLSILVVFKKTVFSKILLVNSLQKNPWANDDLQENVIYIGLKKLVNNGVSEIREREHWIGRALTCAANEKASVHTQFLSGNKEMVQETL